MRRGELEAALRLLADDAASVLRDSGAGAVMVRAIVDGRGRLVLTGRAHERSRGVVQPEELAGFREEVDE